MAQAATSAAQSAPTRGPALNWVRLPGAEACIAPVELAQRIEQRLGRAVFVRANDAIIVIEGRVSPDAAGGFSSEIRVSDPDGAVYGVRELKVADPDCHKLDELVSLVIAITIRHQHGSSGIALPPGVAAELDALFADEPSTLDPSELDWQPVPSALAESRPPPRAAQRHGGTPAQAASAWTVGGEAGFGLVTGLQPATTLGPSLRVRVSLAGIGSLALSASLGLPRDQHIASEAPGLLRYQPMQLGLSVCPAARQLWLSELSFCADVRIGWLRVESHEFVHDLGAQQRFWPELAAVASARTALLGPSYLHLRLGVPIRLIRPQFRYLPRQGPERSAFVVALAGFELELGLGVAF
jgi:hypothetical protein